MNKSSKGQLGVISKAVDNLPKPDGGSKKPSIGELLGGLFPSKPSPVNPNPAIEGIFPSNPNPPNLNVGSAMGNVIKPALPSEPKRDYIDPSLLIPRLGINPPRFYPGLEDIKKGIGIYLPNPPSNPNPPRRLRPYVEGVLPPKQPPFLGIRRLLDKK
jgi:hypothetical protein